MKKVITLKYPAKCADCGSELPAGTKAKWYGKGRVYGLECHTKERELTHKEKYGQCEDAPCCGCCGVHPYYGEM